MEPVPFPLTEEEVKIIRGWFEYFRVDSQHYGDGVALFPQEEIVLRKLDGLADNVVNLTYFDMVAVKSWMDKAVYRRYGSQQYFMGGEEALVHRIEETFSELEGLMKQETQVLKRRAAARQGILYKPEDEESTEDADVSARDERIHNAAESLRGIHHEQDARKNSSFEEKLERTRQLKREMEEAQQKVDEVRRKKK